MRISFETEDFSAISGLQGLESRALNLSPLMKSLALLGKNRARQAFQTQTAPDGTSWKKSWRAKHKGGKTLIDSSNLVRSLGAAWDNQSSEWGAGMEYGIVQQLGATIKPKNGKYLMFTGPDGHLRKLTQVEIPVRPFLPTSPEQLDQDAITDLVNNYLANNV